MKRLLFLLLLFILVGCGNSHNELAQLKVRYPTAIILSTLPHDGGKYIIFLGGSIYSVDWLHGDPILEICNVVYDPSDSNEVK